MHAEFRPVLLGYTLFVVLQFATGIAMYWMKAGPRAADAFEYYRGSEAALQRFPDRPDRFLPEKTAAGILKIQAPHTIAFGALFFILMHLVRSIDASQSAVRAVGAAFLVLSIADFALPFLLLPNLNLDFLFALRFPVVVLFSGGGIALTLLLCFRLR